MDEEITKNKRKGGAPAAGWEVIYTSLVLILVALFAMLASYSSVEEKKMINFLRGFVVISDIDMDGIPSDSIRRNLVNTGGNRVSEDEVILRTSPGVIRSSEESIAMAIKSLETIIGDAGLSDAVQVEGTNRGFKATFGNSVLFPSGIAAINKDAYPFLDKMIEIVREAPFTVRVEGHTDNVPIDTDEFPSNWELSTARAVNVLKYFISKGKIPARRVAAVGFSQYHPVASNDTPEGRKKNRRVEFYFEFHQGTESS